MRKYTTVLHRMVSTKKFYDIVKERKDRNIPKSAEEVIISKYLKDNASFVSSRNESKVEGKKEEKAINRGIHYQHFLQENPNGSMIQMDYKGTLLHMLSLNYQNISLPEIYSLCEKVNPSLIFVQSRPEAYLKTFKLIPKVDDTFSDLKYLQQLCLDPISVRSEILNPEIMQKLEEILGVREKKTQRKVYIHDNKDIVDDDVLMMAGYYCTAKGANLLLGELPEQPWREWLCNSHTLMELQELFKYVCKNIPFYESLKMTPYRLAALLRPEIFLNMRDRYMATLIEMAIATRKHPNILCLMGVGENQAVQQILVQGMLRNDEGKGDFTPLVEYLIGPQVRHSLLKNIEGWEIIEKHLIADTLQHGEGIVSQPLESFRTTNRVIQHYGIQLNQYSKPALFQFRYDKTMAYLELMKTKITEGTELRRKFMLRQAMRVSSQQE